MFSFCPKTAIHSLGAVCREMSDRHLQVKLIKISSFFFLIAGFDSGQPRRCQNIFHVDLYQRHDSLFTLHALER